ncbi:hypothetical protein KBZ15_12735, partial [Cyanobium sp. BA20m-p-22]|uniref:hypothetical protein n=1 Tax=Cyanobium sp. BA20m-p-22 TaxID=2823704 RepID=UPI0020CC4026
WWSTPRAMETWIGMGSAQSREDVLPERVAWATSANVGPWRGVAQELQPSDEWLVFEQESDQASELSGVFWGGVELVLELHKSASSLELSSSSRFSLCSIAYLCTFSSTVGCQLSFANSCRHGGSEERNACLLR